MPLFQTQTQIAWLEEERDTLLSSGANLSNTARTNQERLAMIAEDTQGRWNKAVRLNMIYLASEQPMNLQEKLWKHV